jgi:hypothetical protein
MRLLVAVLVVLLCGCVSTQSKKSDEEIVAELAQKWVDELVKKDFEKAWSYTTPGYRASQSVTVFKRSVAGALNWTDGKVRSVTCEADRCDVVTDISYSLPRFKLENTRPIERVWIKVDGKWWLYQK